MLDGRRGDGDTAAHADVGFGLDFRLGLGRLAGDGRP